MSETERTVALALAPLLATWPEEQMPPVRIRAYIMVLEDLEPELLQAAVAHCIATCKFFPKPAEIRQAAFDLQASAVGLPDPMAAWGAVLAEINRVGNPGIPHFDHQMITDAVRQVGGWRYLCLSEDAASDRARFVQAYTELRQRHEVETRMLPAVKNQVQLLAERLSGVQRLPAPEEAETE